MQGHEVDAVFSGMGSLLKSNQDEFKKAVSRLKKVSFKKGDIILKEKQESDYFYFIMKGEIGFSLRRKGLGGVLRHLGPWEYFGDMYSVFGGHQYVEVSAQKDTELLAIAKSDFKDALPYLEELKKYASGSYDENIEPELAPVPLKGSFPVPVDRLRTDNPAVVPLMGKWKFKLARGHITAGELVSEEGDVNVVSGFSGTDFDDSGWAETIVPSNWEMEGFSIPTFGGPDSTAGLYRRRIKIPADFSGKLVMWHFDGVNNGCEVFVNGKKLYYHESGTTAFDVDVTDAIKPGAENLLAVSVAKITPSCILEAGEFWALGGIFRETYLFALPPLYVGNVVVTTKLYNNYTDAKLKAAVKVRGPKGKKFVLKAELLDINAEKVAVKGLCGAGIIDDNGTAVIEMQASVKGPKLWSAEKPNLYYLVVSLETGGEIIECVQERFGFREIEIKKGVLHWNGVPIKCTGCCRHEIWPTLGKALNDEAWRKELSVMRDANINSIRTSHYNFGSRFMELCDELGFYVLAEVPFSWCTCDITMLSSIMLRTRETLARNKNHPCVLAWSLGNENERGPSIQNVVDYVKKFDPARPSFASCAPAEMFPGVSFDDFHYPTVNEVARIAKDPARKTTPAIITENPIVFSVSEALDYDYGFKDLWGEVLNEYWQIIWAYDSMLGSFIWEWQDQGVADKYPDKTINFDRCTGLRMAAIKGVVSAYRVPKPEHWHVKMCYSPVNVITRKARPAGSWLKVDIENRYSFTDLSELFCVWQALNKGKVITNGETRVTCKPRAKTRANFPLTKGMDELKLEFIDPDKRIVTAASVKLPKWSHPEPVHALPKGSQLETKQDDGAIVIANDLTKISFDKKYGQITSWMIDGQNMLIGGPVFNIGEGFSSLILKPELGTYKLADFAKNKQLPDLKNISLTALPAGSHAGVEFRGDLFAADSKQKKAELMYKVEILPDADVNIVWELKWLGVDIKAWELGLKLFLPADFEKIGWSRDGLWTEYSPGHIADVSGSAGRDDVSFRSTKRNVHWFEMSGGGKYSLVMINSGTDLHARASYSEESVVLFANSSMSSPVEYGSNRFSEYLADLKKGHVQKGCFRLRAARPGFTEVDSL